MAMSTFQCQPFERDNVESYLARFLLHCQVHDVKEEKMSTLLLTSVDSQRCNSKNLIKGNYQL